MKFAYSIRGSKRRALSTIATVVFVLFSCYSVAFSQEVSSEVVAAAPEKKISKGEKEQLEKESDAKRRTTLSLSLMETRAVRTEASVANNSFTDALNELGGFEALLEDSVSFLNKNDNGSGKIRVSQKKIELALRKYATRFETVRRAMPYKYSFHVQRLLKVLRETRTKLIEPFFDDTVVRS